MFISPSVFSPSCAVWTLSPKSLVAVAGHRLFLHRQHAPAARKHGLPARLLACSGCTAACSLWLLAFIPYAKVKKLILTHYILFIWKNRCFFFPMTLRSGAASSVFPMALRIGTSARSCFPILPHRPSWSISRRAATSSAQISAAAPLPVSSSAAAPWPAALPRLRLSAVALPQRPSQQQTSSGGENYSGLTSNLAHLGRIC